jgi:CheY-like chemotaxis protein
VVIVDDNCEVREFLRFIIEPLGYTVAEFADGASALYYIKNPRHSKRIVSVISDLMMNKKDGIDLLAAIRTNESLKNLKFYLVTGADLNVFKNLVQPYHIDQVIEKPFREEDIRRLITPDSNYKLAA